MYKTIISHLSALSVYRSLRNSQFINQPYVNITKNNLSTPTINTLNSLDIPLLDNIAKIDITVLARAQYRILKNTSVHYYTQKLPKNSFCKLTPEILISSPEFLFCQLADILPLEKLALFGLEICGSYHINNNNQAFSKDLKPISSTNAINNFVKSLKSKYYKFPSINKCFDAVKMIGDNSASPQESRLYIMLASPHKHGGYGIKNLKLNEKIPISKTAKTIAEQPTIQPDISNSKTKISIEYDSNMFHDNTNQNTRDKRRINALSHDGWRVYSFVPSEVYNVDILHNMALDILKSNKQNNRIKMRDFIQKRNTLHNNLFLS